MIWQRIGIGVLVYFVVGFVVNTAWPDWEGFGLVAVICGVLAAWAWPHRKNLRDWWF